MANDSYKLTMQAPTDRPSYYRYLNTQSSMGEQVTTVLVSNLHCSSCVKTIEATLAHLSPPPFAVEISIVSQTVTVHHIGLSPEEIVSAIINEGFDVAQSFPSSSKVKLDSIQDDENLLAARQKSHLDNCQFCQDASRSSTISDKWEDAEIRSLSSDVGTSKKYLPHSLEAATATPEGPLRVTLSVGGMTCTSCTSAVTRSLTELDGVHDVGVSLIDKAATVVISDQKLVEVIVEAVEDCGFDARIISVESNSSAEKLPNQIRKVELKIEGMFCPNCPDRINDALDKHPQANYIVSVDLPTLNSPIITITYLPSPPDFSLRTLVSIISKSNSSNPFKVSVYTPPSIESLSRLMQSREKRALLLRLLFNFVCAIPTFIIGVVYMTLVTNGNATKEFLMAPMWAGNASRAEWALFFLATPVMFYSASIFHRRSLKEIHALWRKGSKATLMRRFTRFGSMNLLVSAGVSVAYFASIALLILAALENPSNDMSDTTTYFDSVVFLTMFLLAGRYLESYSKARTADAVSALGKLRPQTALLVTPTNSIEQLLSVKSVFPDIEKQEKSDDSLHTPEGSTLTSVPIEYLEVGDVVRVPYGSSPPADGTLVKGMEGLFDESSLTGESRLVKKDGEDKVFMGTINKGKALDIKVAEIGGATMLDHIVKVVREGQTRRAPIERIVDLVTGYFVPIITLIAIFTWVIWLGLGLGGVLPPDYLNIHIGGWPIWALRFAIAVFVVACPCGIGLAAPTALLVGSGLAAKHGILARGGGEAFQEMAQVDLLVFDKTGTITEGSEPKVSDFEFIDDNGLEEKTVLGMIMAIEEHSSHPLSTAIRNFCNSRPISTVSTVDCEEVSGKGLKASFNDYSAIVGNEPWAEQHGAKIDGRLSQRLESWKSEGKSVVIVAIASPSSADATDDNESLAAYRVAAAFAVSDTLRPEAKGVISKLHAYGISTWMISGDNVKTASAVAKLVGIPSTNVLAGVLPHEKAAAVRRLQLEGPKRKSKGFGTNLNQRCVVGMVGDGINDAPALTAADVGIAIGSGSDVAISSASFILLSSNLKSIITLSHLSRRVFNRVKFNFMWAAVYNIVLIPIAAGVLYPAGHILLNPVWASLAMALSSVSVVCSSLLLKLYKEPRID